MVGQTHLRSEKDQAPQSDSKPTKSSETPKSTGNNPNNYNPFLPPDDGSVTNDTPKPHSDDKPKSVSDDKPKPVSDSKKDKTKDKSKDKKSKDKKKGGKDNNVVNLESSLVDPHADGTDVFDKKKKK